MVKRIQREVTLSITQRHDFVRIIYYVWQCLTIYNSRFNTISSVY